LKKVTPYFIETDSNVLIYNTYALAEYLENAPYGRTDEKENNTCCYAFDKDSRR